ncbi:MAG: pilus assembly protein N-terminal domain-containing protein, partial [Rhizobiaceae bacterium]|nr:pilus assembly protein N-terminal domain-containing protein [Rhizobiaceae bacterium]
MLALTLLVGSVPAQIGISDALAAKNYLKISSSMIGKSKNVKVGLNKSIVIDLPGDAHDILVANPAIADAITRTSRRIYIFAKQVGETNIFIFDSRGRQLLSIELTIERDIAGLQKFLKKYIRGSDITVEIMNDNVILTGSVPTPQASAKAVQLADVFVTGGEATTDQYSGGSTVAGGSGTTIVFGDDEERQKSQIVNLLTIDGEDQVMLKVTIAEIQRTIVKQLGIDLSSSLASGNLIS